MGFQHRFTYWHSNGVPVHSDRSKASLQNEIQSKGGFASKPAPEEESVSPAYLPRPVPAFECAFSHSHMLCTSTTDQTLSLSLVLSS